MKDEIADGRCTNKIKSNVNTCTFEHRKPSHHTRPSSCSKRSNRLVIVVHSLQKIKQKTTQKKTIQEIIP